MKRKVISILTICFMLVGLATFAEDEVVIIPKSTVSVLVSAPLDTFNYGDEVILTATVMSEDTLETTFNGNITFFDGTAAISSAIPIQQNAASYTITPTVTIGTHPIHAEFSNGTINSTSNIKVITVTNANTTTTLQTSKSSIGVKREIIFTATVGKAKSGTVDFFNDTEKIGSSTVNTFGIAEFKISTLLVKTHNIKAIFLGDDNYNSSISNTISQTVLSDNNILSKLKANGESIKLSSNKEKYSLSYDNSDEEIYITPIAEDSDATITVNGEPVESGEKSDKIYLRSGSTTNIEIEVTAANGDVRVYILSVSRAKSKSSHGKRITYRYGGETAQTVYGDLAYHWADSSIYALTSKGIFTGELNENISYFYPERNMTRTEFSVIISRMMGLDTRLTRFLDLPFNDVESIPEWGVEEVRAVYYKGWVDGDGQSFYPEDSITRAEAMTVISRITGYKGEQVYFNDSDKIPEWAQGSIAGLVNSGIVSGDPENTIRPNDTITRAEIANMAYKTLKLQNKI